MTAPTEETFCWCCGKAYAASEASCPHCCATNANVDLESAKVEMADESRIEHDWQFQDDSFGHEFGTEIVHYFQCQRCGKERNVEAGDFDVEDWP